MLSPRSAMYETIVEGCHVNIRRGTYRGQTGVFVKWPESSYFGFRISAFIRLNNGYDDDPPVCIRLTSIKFNNNTNPINNDSNSPIVNMVTTTTNATTTSSPTMQLEHNMRLIADSFDRLSLELNDTRTRLSRIEAYLNDSVVAQPVDTTQPLTASIVENIDDV
jgi:hypothetical protein